MSTATTMQAVICRNGAPVCARVPVPETGPDEVLVKVQACALNRADLAMAAGAKHGALGGEGAVLGMEWSGVVVRTGARVPSLRPGQRVMGSGRGAFAEYAVADRGRVLPLPEGSDDPRQAACLPVALQIMHDALVTHGGLGAGNAGQSVLILGASSGVGLMGLQIAREMGAALVIGSSTQPERRARLAEFGADLAVDTRDPTWPDQVLQHTGGNGVDIVVDMLAGPTLNASMRATALGGTIVNVGRLAGKQAEFDFDLHALRRIRFVGVTFRTRTAQQVREITGRMLRDLSGALERGALRLPIDCEFPLEQASQALRHMRANGHFGKIVLTVR
ncbi:zinc-binding dehydrogenase [Cupriavidus sp. DB3]|uniref:quinone oxidoreductase family protein n=1 Tax=Cupriavidus sp. DB3 TaxID=2873259 RepID=UPI001CF4ADAC|nr:zinc-binding dehydrogenase [Cupriavidus sp. DB3]MCA7082477.1 zinc-binding dehydrogenase [Cupriavidus sp. DB3]